MSRASGTTGDDTIGIAIVAVICCGCSAGERGAGGFPPSVCGISKDVSTAAVQQGCMQYCDPIMVPFPLSGQAISQAALWCRDLSLIYVFVD